MSFNNTCQQNGYILQITKLRIDSYFFLLVHLSYVK